jgi:hypothetical protein
MQIDSLTFNKDLEFWIIRFNGLETFLLSLISKNPSSRFMLDTVGVEDDICVNLDF